MCYIWYATRRVSVEFLKKRDASPFFPMDILTYSSRHLVGNLWKLGCPGIHEYNHHPKEEVKINRQLTYGTTWWVYCTVTVVTNSFWLPPPQTYHLTSAAMDPLAPCIRHIIIDYLWLLLFVFAFSLWSVLYCCYPLVMTNIAMENCP